MIFQWLALFLGSIGVGAAAHASSRSNDNAGSFFRKQAPVVQKQAPLPPEETDPAPDAVNNDETQTIVTIVPDTSSPEEPAISNDATTVEQTSTPVDSEPVMSTTQGTTEMPGETDMPTDMPDMTEMPAETDMTTDMPGMIDMPAETHVTTDMPGMTDMPSETDMTTDMPGMTDMPGETDMTHDHMDAPVTLPTTSAEVEAFVTTIKSSEEVHVHDAGSVKLPEHQALLDLVPRADATHIAIGNGSWFDADNWYEGRIPESNAKVLIPDGVHMTYDGESGARLLTVRVDGRLEFANDVSSKMVVDTMVVTPGAQLTIGTEHAPVEAGVKVDIVIANNGPIDVDWDPMLLSRGIVSHGDVEIHGAVTDSHDKVIDDPMEGDTWLDFGDLPEGWEVGDTIVIAGTHYDGYSWDNTVGALVHHEPEDEIRTISHIDGTRVFFDDPLIFDHDAPRDDLKTSVANYSRNVTIATENGADAEVHERGHVMFMHSDNINVSYAEFFELGRTDKSELALNASEFDDIASDSNVKGRYAVHIHRAGVDDPDHPAVIEGNAVFGSPGWGFVHHDSNALLDNNATYNTFGAGYVAESGNETGSWTDNIAIYAKGTSWTLLKNGVDLGNFDTGKTGDGFWFQGRMVESSGNIAASVNHGFAYFHRGAFADDAQMQFNANVSAIPGAFHYAETVNPDDVPILNFHDNEVFAAKQGLHVVKANSIQGHDVHSVLDGFTAWSVLSGAQLEYTSHYLLKDFDLVAREDADFNHPLYGIAFGPNVFDMTIVDAKIDGFRDGIDLHKSSTTDAITPDTHDYTIVNADIENVTESYANYDPALDTILSGASKIATPDILLDGPLTYKEGYPDPTARVVEISGSKTDSLGTTEFGTGPDNFNVRLPEVVKILETQGYYSNEDGSKYFLLDLYFSDRLTGEIFFETHPVFINDNVPLGSEFHSYHSAKDNGLRDLQSPDTSVSDDAILLDILTFEQGAYSEEAANVDEEVSGAEYDAAASSF